MFARLSWLFSMFGALAKRDSKSNHSESSASTKQLLLCLLLRHSYHWKQKNKKKKQQQHTIEIGLVSGVIDVLDFWQVCWYLPSIPLQNKMKRNKKYDARELVCFTAKWKGTDVHNNNNMNKNYYRSHNFYWALIHQWLWVAMQYTLLVQVLRSAPMLSIRLYTYLSSRCNITGSTTEQYSNMLSSTSSFTTSHRIHMAFRSLRIFHAKNTLLFQWHLSVSKPIDP